MRWQRGTSDAGHRGPPGRDGRRRVRGVPGRRGLKLGLGGLIIVGILSLVFKQNFFALLGDLPADTGTTSSVPAGAAGRDDAGGEPSATSS